MKQWTRSKSLTAELYWSLVSLTTRIQQCIGTLPPVLPAPYFASIETPSRRPAMKSDEEAEVEKSNTQRKRPRIILRGDTPEEPPPPPCSPEEFSRALRSIKPNLIQEFVCEDPWKIIVATTLLNKTTGKAAVPVFWELIKRWPTPIALAQAAAPSLTKLLRPLGTQSMRTSRLIRLSNAYAMHPPSFSSQPKQAMGSNVENEATLVVSPKIERLSQCSPSSPKDVGGNNVTCVADEARSLGFARISAKEYRVIQQTSPIAHLPFTGPYAIDSFRIFSPALHGGGAGARVEEQLRRVARLAGPDLYSCIQVDFDETPGWYNSGCLRVVGDEDAEWRKVQPEDKQLRRYLVWRWAIEGVEYNPDGHTYRPADWSYLNELIRR